MHELLLSYAILLLMYWLSWFRISSFNPYFFSEEASWLVEIILFSIVCSNRILSENFSLRRKEKIKINISSFSKSDAWVRERWANRVMRWISNWETRENSERVEQRYPHTPFLFFTRKRVKKIRENRFSPYHYQTDTLLCRIRTLSTLLNFLQFKIFMKYF